MTSWKSWSSSVKLKKDKHMKIIKSRFKPSLILLLLACTPLIMGQQDCVGGLNSAFVGTWAQDGVEGSTITFDSDGRFATHAGGKPDSWHGTYTVNPVLSIITMTNDEDSDADSGAFYFAIIGNRLLINGTELGSESYEFTRV